MVQRGVLAGKGILRVEFFSPGFIEIQVTQDTGKVEGVQGDAMCVQVVK